MVLDASDIWAFALSFENISLDNWYQNDQSVQFYFPTQPKQRVE